MSRNMWYLSNGILLLVSILIALPLCADTVKTVDGKIYENVTKYKKRKTFIMFDSAEGVSILLPMERVLSVTGDDGKPLFSASLFADTFENKVTGEIVHGESKGAITKDGVDQLLVRLEDGSKRFLVEDDWKRTTDEQDKEPKEPTTLDFWFSALKEMTTDRTLTLRKLRELKKKHSMMGYPSATESVKAAVAAVGRDLLSQRENSLRRDIDLVCEVIESFGLPAGRRALQEVKRIPINDWGKKSATIHSFLGIAAESDRGIVEVAWEGFVPTVRRLIKKGDWKRQPIGSATRYPPARVAEGILERFLFDLRTSYKNRSGGFQYSKKGKQEILPRSWVQTQKKKRKRLFGD